MTTIAATSNTDTLHPSRTPIRALLRVSSIAVVLAAAATEALAAVVRTAGVDLAVGDPGGSADSVVAVNAGACAIVIVMCMVIGTALAALISRYASRPARTYRVTASVLIVASLAAPLTAAATAGSTRLTLVAAHLLAGAIIVPLVSRSLPTTR